MVPEALQQKNTLIYTNLTIRKSCGHFLYIMRRCILNILLSIHSEYSDAIYNGTKHYEFRKKIPKERPERVYIYTTLPVGAVTGYFEVEDIISDTPEALWELTRNHAGIDKESYDKYFKGCPVAYAYKIKKAVRFVEPLKWYNAPQSFAYLHHTGQDAMNKKVKNTQYFVTTPFPFRQRFLNDSFDAFLKEHYEELSKYYPGFWRWFNGKVLEDLRKFPYQREIICLCKNVMPGRTRIMGFCIIKNTPDEKKICTIFVRPSKRNRGYAYKLICRAIFELKEGRPLITVNENIYPFFEKLNARFGWQVTSVEADKYIQGQKEYVINGTTTVERS